MLKTTGKFLLSFFELFYPRICAACDQVLVGNEDIFCTNCLTHLPETNYHLQEDNPVKRIFWGRIQLENATSYLFFEKGAIIQKSLHQLKYRGNKQVGFKLGKLFGYSLKNTSFSNADIILPVPLHPAKKRKRGYNQSEEISRGLSEILKIPVDSTSVKRSYYQKSQTVKGRYDRWENVKNAFICKTPAKLEGKHILLVDDVVTTGATLEAMASVIQEIPNIKLSIATLAFVH